jgi:signal transduction histidine kinase
VRLPRLRLPRLWRRRQASVRLRLTLTYSSLFVVSGAALLGVCYLLVSQREHRSGTTVSIVCSATKGGVVAAGGSSNSGFIVGQSHGQSQSSPSSGSGQAPGQVCPKGDGFGAGAFVARGGSVSTVPVSGKPASPPPQVLRQLQQLKAAVADSQAHTLRSLLIESVVALGLLTVASLGLGWWIAGRVLRPVHQITDTARRLSEETLHDRINLDGPHDELKELADTFDAMLVRLDRAFSSQRRFVANASHELRTPLATERVLIDEALANRGARPEDFRAILEQLRVNSEETERLIDALLWLARSERGVDRRSAVDLATVAEGVITRAGVEAVTAGVELREDLNQAPVAGDPGLLERLVGNLVENGIRHNRPGGWLSVTTSSHERWATLEVANSGRALDPDTVGGLMEPFRRDAQDRSSSDAGFGLGLSIVQAIVTAHAGQLQLTARPEGGLHVSVRLRASALPQRAAGLPVETTITA